MNDNEIICGNITFGDYRKGNFDDSPVVPLYKRIFENENLIARKNILTGKVKFEFKPNCPKSVKNMWKKLNQN